MEIVPLSDAVGVEIKGVDLREPLDSNTLEQIEDAFNEHAIILLRDQDISLGQQKEFAQHFGELGSRNRPGKKPNELDEYGEHVMLVTNVREKGKPIGSLPDGEMTFHADTAYFEFPSKATMLYAMELTSWGGNTLFSNCYTAAEELPEDLKRRLDGKKAMQVYEYGTTLKMKEKYDRDNFPHYAHPVFRKHPESGRSALFVSELMTEEIVGLPKEESDEILEALFEHQKKPEFVYEHPWKVGDLVLWDNRCTIHARTDFPRDERRMLRRLTIQDTKPVVEGAVPYKQAAAE
ncbi:MAG: taurine catabolism dioxygenase TauD [Rhodospirillaceae bacterium]|nr:taurine catabolism dioxygenase TauD [Rhodospirillaceae bacterium]|tara:strand:+ start:8661 stop:9536 length:876 start_codon:yes stop_codon:yes gene_type:complete